MLSKSERKFLIEGKASSPGHARVLKHGISKKIEQFLNRDLPTLKKRLKTEQEQSA